MKNVFFWLECIEFNNIDNLENFIKIEQNIWDKWLIKQDGFISKEILINPNNLSGLIISVKWKNQGSQLAAGTKKIEIDRMTTEQQNLISYKMNKVTNYFVNEITY